MIIGSLMVGNTASFNYKIKAIQKLFLVKSLDKKLFRRAKNKKFLRSRSLMLEIAKSGSNKETTEAKNEIRQTQHIKLTVKQKLRIFMMSTFGPCFDYIEDRSNSRIWRLYERGSNMLDKQMDVVKILRKLRHLKIISKLKFETPELLLEVYRQSKNYINIDSDVVNSEDIEDFCSSEEEQPEHLDDPKSKNDFNIKML